MRNLKASILSQRNEAQKTELGIGFGEQAISDGVFDDLPSVLLDVPHEVFRGMKDGSREKARVRTYWLAHDWGRA